MAEAKAFHKTTWAKVEKGDVILMAWESLREIVEIELSEVATEISTFDRKDLVVVSFDFCGHHFPRWSFDPDGDVYVRSRI